MRPASLVLMTLFFANSNVAIFGFAALIFFILYDLQYVEQLSSINIIYCSHLCRYVISLVAPASILASVIPMTGWLISIENGWLLMQLSS